MMMRRWLSVVVVAALVLAGCGKRETTSGVQSAEDAVAENAPVAEPAEEPSPDAPPPPPSQPTTEAGMIAAAEAEDGDARYRLAEHYREQGRLAEALRWFKRAAQLRHPRATYEVGLFYRDGLCGEASPEKARRCFALAGELGYGPGDLALQEMHRVAQGHFRGMDKEAATKAVRLKVEMELEEYRLGAAFQAWEAETRQALWKEHGVTAAQIERTEVPSKEVVEQQIAQRLEQADIEGQLAAQYGPEKREEVMAAARKAVAGWEVGDLVTVTTRRGPLQGRITAIRQDMVKVGAARVLLSDLPQEERDKLDPVRIQRERDRFVQREFVAPRAAMASSLRERIAAEAWAEHGYVQYRSHWVPASALVARVIEPKLSEAREEHLAARRRERTATLLEQAGFFVIRGKVLTMEERDRAVAAHTQSVTDIRTRIAGMLREAKGVADFDRALQFANTGLARFFLADNLDTLKKDRAALLRGREQLVQAARGALSDAAKTRPAPPPAAPSQTKRESRIGKRGQQGFGERL